jgi:hypothetical protein
MSIDYRLKKAEDYYQSQKPKPKLNMDLVKEQAYELIAKEHGLSVKELKKTLEELKKTLHYEDLYKEDPEKFAKDNITISKGILAHIKDEKEHKKLLREHRLKQAKKLKANK